MTAVYSVSEERELLGSILLNNDWFDFASTILHFGEFVEGGNRRIFEAMGLLRRRGCEISLVTLKDELKAMGLRDGVDYLAEIGGPVYISALIDGAPRAGSVERNVHIVSKQAMLRRLIDVTEQILSKAYDGQLAVASRILQKLALDAKGWIDG